MIKWLKECWYRMSIRSKQFAFYIIIIALISLFSFFALDRYNNFIHQYNVNTNRFFNAVQLKKELIESRTYISNFLESLELSELNNYNESVYRFEEAIVKMEAETVSLNEYLLLRAVKNSYISAYDEYNAAIRERRASSPKYLIHEYKARRIYHYMLDYIDDLSEISLIEGNALSKRLMRNARLMQSVILVGIIFMTLICLGFGVMFSNYLTKPIKQLAILSSQMAKGDLKVEPLRNNSKDEVGVLADSFNRMSVSIRKMVNDLKNKTILEKKLHDEEIKNITMEQLLKEARFLSLQSQINPHFLFNTLNTISRIVMFGKNNDAMRLIESFSNLLRYNLGDFHKQVPLKKELEIIKHYLYIQQYRFEERLNFSIVCSDPELLEVPIPCFALQPLVENSIIHGIEPKEDGGKIRIKISALHDEIIIKIIDNGVGIPKQRMEAIQTLKQNNHTGHSNAIGIANVVHRLTIFTGQSQCFGIRSIEGFGTLVTVRIPKKRGDCLGEAINR
jgi:two-component system sensor histidine kinase YesM